MLLTLKRQGIWRKGQWPWTLQWDCRSLQWGQALQEVGALLRKLCLLQYLQALPRCLLLLLPHHHHHHPHLQSQLLPPCVAGKQQLLYSPLLLQARSCSHPSVLARASAP